MTDIRKNLFTSLLILALTVAFLVSSYQLTAKGQLVPVLVGWVGVLLCVLDVIAHTENRLGRTVAMVLSGSAHLQASEDAPPLSLEIPAMAWMVIGTAAILVFGFMIAVPVYVFAYMVMQGRRPLVQSGLTALATTLFIWIVFEILMEYEIYRGLLFSDL